jgi:hypothetical protein
VNFYSVKHEQDYQTMVSEMVKFADFQDNVLDVLRYMSFPYSYQSAKIIDDLYTIWIAQPVVVEVDK